MSLLKLLPAFLRLKSQPKVECRRFIAPTPKQSGRKADAIRLLMRRGYITLRDLANMGDNSPAKTILRMRLDGVLNPDADNTCGFRDVPNHKAPGTHRRYLWTGKRPAGWPEPERRSVKRGGRA